MLLAYHRAAQTRTKLLILEREDTCTLAAPSPHLSSSCSSNWKGFGEYIPGQVPPWSLGGMLSQKLDGQATHGLQHPSPLGKVAAAGGYLTRDHTSTGSWLLEPNGRWFLAWW